MTGMGTRIMRAISLMLAVVMVVTAIPQTATTVYGAQIDESEELGITLDSEVVDEVAPESDGEVIADDTSSGEVVDEQTVAEETTEDFDDTDNQDEIIGEEIIDEPKEEDFVDFEEVLPNDEILEAEDEELSLEEDNPDAQITFIVDTGGAMYSKDDMAVGWAPTDGPYYVSQSFLYSGSEGSYTIIIGSRDNIIPTRDGYIFDGWYDINNNPLPDPLVFDTRETREYYAKWKLAPLVIFDANGGKIPYVDDHAVMLDGEQGAFTMEGFEYYEEGGKYYLSINSMDHIKPSMDDATFIGWYDADGNKFSWEGFDTEEERTYYAKWRRSLGDAPQIDTGYGTNGIKLFTDGSNKARFSMKVNKSDYEDILNSLDEEKEVLRIYYQYAAQKPVHGGSSTPDADGYYYRWNTQLINKDDDYTEFPGEAFDAYDYDYLFDANPSKAVGLRFSLAYVVVEKDDEGSWIKWEDWSNVVGESKYSKTKTNFTPFATSTSIKNESVLKPIIGGAQVSSAITVNTGAAAKNLGFKYVNEDFDEEIAAPENLEVIVTGGQLKVKALSGWTPGDKVNIVLYDTTNPTEWNEQFLADTNRFTITPVPGWVSQSVSASVTSATDVSLNFKVSAPKGVDLSGGNYYIGVGLASNRNTAKGLKGNLVIADRDEIFFPVNDDGTIPEITIKPFREDSVDGAVVEQLGKGCGTSMDAIFYIVMTDGDAPNEGGNILAITDVKKCKTITAATKAPYYADKITLKKVNANLYAGDCDVIVATVDFGGNATYTTKDCWKIANKAELEENGISAVQDGDNKVKVSVGDDVLAGKYTINAETVAESEMGVPAKASITVTVLPTASNVTADPVTIYRKINSKGSYKVTPNVTDQGGAVIKNAAYTYEIGSGDTSPLDPVSGLTVNKGTINVDKSVPAGEYRLKITAKCGREVSSDLISVQIVEGKIALAGFGFGEGTPMASIKNEMTLAEYNDLGWDKSYIADASAIMSINDIAGSGLQLRDSNNKVVTWNLIKSVKIPNPKYIKKTGKITLSAEAIDGTKLSKDINIVQNSNLDMHKLHIEGGLEDKTSEAFDSRVIDVSGAGINTEFKVWLSDVSDNTKNTLTDISPYKMTVKGAKVVNNYHDDYITFVMTGKTATLELFNGKVSQGTIMLQNDTFTKTSPKKITAENKKIYTNFTDDAGTQDICYQFSSAIEGMDSFRLQTTNKTLSPWINSIIAHPVNNDALRLTISPEVSRGLKAGSYTIAVEPLDESGKALCKPFNITLKLENLKKSFKVKNSYTMSYKDATAVPLEITSTSGLSSSGDAPVLLDDNIKGQYNKITDILEINEDGIIRLKDGKKFADKVTSMTGYIKYTVYWLDGTKEDRLEKITVKMSDKPVFKLRTPDFVRYYEAGTEDVFEDLPVYDSKTYLLVKIAQVAVFDSKTEELLKDGTVELQADGKLKFTVKPKGTGKVTLKLNVIPEASIYKNDPITKDNSIPITVTINYKKW